MLTRLFILSGGESRKWKVAPPDFVGQALVFWSPELPTYWFKAGGLRRISELLACPAVLKEWAYQGPY